MRKLRHFPDGTRPRTKLTLSLVFVIPDPIDYAKCSKIDTSFLSNFLNLFNVTRIINF